MSYQNADVLLHEDCVILCTKCDTCWPWLPWAVFNSRILWEKYNRRICIQPKCTSTPRDGLMITAVTMLQHAPILYNSCPFSSHGTICGCSYNVLLGGLLPLHSQVLQQCFCVFHAVRECMHKHFSHLPQGKNLQ